MIRRTIRRNTEKNPIEHIKKMRSAENIDFEKLRFFNKSEFPTGVLEWMDVKIISQTHSLREEMPIDCYFYPSPLFGGHVRHTIRNSVSSDFHSTAMINNKQTRLSTATDMFVHPKYWFEVWWRAVARFNGVGIYLGHFMILNKEKVYYPMFHFDTRNENNKTYWIRDLSGKYVYLHNNPAEFISLMESAHNRWKKYLQ